MDKTPNLQLSLMANKQGQRPTYHDNALKDLDTLVMLSVLDRDLSSPPASPSDGDRYIVKTPGSSDPAWVDDNVVVYMEGHWWPHEPKLGWTCYVQDESALLAWDGSSWRPAIEVTGLDLENLSRLGLGTTADGTNPLSAKLNNTLWTAKTVAEGGDGNLHYKLSKESSPKTLSFLLQDNFSGRAEIELTGDDDLHFKVSADGSIWLDAIVIDRTSGKLTFGQGFSDPVATRTKAYAAPFDTLAFNGMQLNGSVEVSQELGTAGATITNNTAKYVADGWQVAYNHGAATAVVVGKQLAAASFPSALPGYSFALDLQATTALSSPANNDYAAHCQAIEGYRVSRLGWGTSAAQSLSYAFNFYSTASGVIFVKAYNAAAARFHYVEHTISAGWNWCTGTIPGDTTGTWGATNGIGLNFAIFSAGKSSSQAAPGAWTTTNVVQTTNNTNLLGSNGNRTIVTGFVVLPGIELPSSSRAPLIMRPLDQELVTCKRYWQTVNTASGPAFGTTSVQFYFFHRNMRAAPTVTVSAAVTISDVYATNATQSSGNISVDTSDADGGAYNLANFTGLTVGRWYSSKPSQLLALLNSRL